MRKQAACAFFEEKPVGASGRATAYLTRHLMDAAARLLRESAMSAAEIAAACGFSDASYFGKVFRRAFGCTPAQYRRRS